MNCVILHPKETTRNSVLPNAKKLPTADELKTVLRRSTSPEYIGAWKWGTLQIHLFGFKTGKSGTENKHDLPPPFDGVVLYGEAVVVATKQDDVVNFTLVDYKKFYNDTVGEQEDVGGDESEEGEEEEEEEEIEEEELSEKEDVIEEEEEIAPIVLPKTATKPKRGNRKLPAWFMLPELEPEAYTL